MAESQSHHNTNLTVCCHPTTWIISLTGLAGYAYCAIGALSLLDRPQDSSAAQTEKALKDGIPNREGLFQFLAARQFAYLAQEEEDDEEEENFLEAKLGDAESYSHVGFNGRWNKKADTCYCWWVGGTLAVSSPNPSH